MSSKALFLSLSFFGLSLGFSTISSNAQETMTFGECLEYAHKNNIQLKQLQLNVESSDENLKQSKASRLPNANGSIGHGFSFGRNIDPTTNSFSTEVIQSQSIGISSSMTIYNGMQNRNTIKQRQMQYDLTELEIDRSTNDLDLLLLSSYMNILLAEEQFGVLKQQAELTKERLSNSQKLVNAGVLPAGDLLDIEAQIATDNLNIVNAENRVGTAYLALSQSLNLYEKFKVEKPALDIPAAAALDLIDPERVYQEALRTQPQMKTADLASKIAELGMKISEGARLPELSLNGNLGTRYSSLAQRIDTDAPFVENSTTVILAGEEVTFSQLVPSFEETPYFSQLGDNFGAYIGVNLNVPIFNRRLVKNAIAQSKIAVENASYQKELEQNQLRNAIEQAYLDAKAAGHRYEATKKSMSSLMQAENYAKKRFDLGVINTLEYFIAKNNYAAAALDLESAKYEYFFRLKILDFYQGKDISF